MLVPSEIIRTIGLVTVLATVFVHSGEIHDDKSGGEIVDVLQTYVDYMPGYEVILMLYSWFTGEQPGRNLRLQFTAFGQKIDAYFYPTDSFLVGSKTPVWLASTNPDGTVAYKKMRDDIMGIVVGMYSSDTNTDSIVAWQRDGEPVAFEGFLNGLIIRSVPNRWPKLARNRRGSKFPETNGTLFETYPHVIIKSSSSMNANEALKTLQTQIASKTRSSNESDRSRSKRSTKDTIFPSILVTTDYSTNKAPENDFMFYDEIIYQLAFWNGVDLRFRSVNDPKIRLRIAGIIIALDREATPYFTKYRQGDRWVVFPQEFPEIVQYWAEMRKRPEFSGKAYDMVVTVTDNDMSREYNDTRIQRVAGIGSTGSLCRRPNQDFDATAVVSDRGGFRGVTTTVHEIGHILGLTHDDDAFSSCNAAYYEYIMSSSGVGPNNLRWSPCSLRRLSKLMRADRINCVDEPANFHDPGRPVRIILPGTISNADKQCLGYRYRVACMVGPNICQNMKCAYEWEDQNNTALCYDIGPAAEGTPCSDGHICLNGQCECSTNDCLYTHAES